MAITLLKIHETNRKDKQGEISFFKTDAATKGNKNRKRKFRLYADSYAFEDTRDKQEGEISRERDILH